MIPLDLHGHGHVVHLHSEAFYNKTGYVGSVKDGIQHYVFVLMPYPEDAADEFIEHITHGR